MANTNREMGLNHDLSLLRTFDDSIWSTNIRFKSSRFDSRFDLKYLLFRLEMI